MCLEIYNMMTNSVAFPVYTELSFCSIKNRIECIGRMILIGVVVVAGTVCLPFFLLHSVCMCKGNNLMLGIVFPIPVALFSVYLMIRFLAAAILHPALAPKKRDLHPVVGPLGGENYPPEPINPVVELLAKEDNVIPPKKEIDSEKFISDRINEFLKDQSNAQKFLESLDDEDQKALVDSSGRIDTKKFLNELREAEPYIFAALPKMIIESIQKLKKPLSEQTAPKFMHRYLKNLEELWKNPQNQALKNEISTDLLEDTDYNNALDVYKKKIS